MASILARANAWWSRHNGVLVVGGLILALSALTVWLMWYFGIIPSSIGRTTESVKAVIGLVGTFATVSVSLVGLLLKSSFDERTLALNEQAQKRLRVDTTARVIGLLTTSDGNLAPPEQQVGTLCALANLGEVALALALLERDWAKPERKRAVDPGSAVWILNLALTDRSSAGHRNQLEAAQFIASCSKSLLTERGFLFPACVYMAWPATIPILARLTLLETILKLLAARPYKEWHPGVVSDFGMMLVRIEREDPDMRDKAKQALRILFDNEVLDADRKPDDGVRLDGELVKWGDVRREVDDAPGEKTLEVLEKLETWAGDVKKARHAT